MQSLTLESSLRYVTLYPDKFSCAYGEEIGIMLQVFHLIFMELQFLEAKGKLKYVTLIRPRDSV